MARSNLAPIMFCTCNNLRMASRAVTQLYDEALKPIGLRATQFSLLGAVALSGPIAISELAEQLVTDRTTLTRNFKPLVKAGLLEIAAGEDQRRRLVQITEQGQIVLQQAFPLWEQAQAKMISGLGDETWQQLLDMLGATVAAAHKP
jgi:DNA-binding MarR family transcriptional regulator